MIGTNTLSKQMEKNYKNEGCPHSFFYDIIIPWRDKNSMKKLMKLICVFALVFVAGCGASSSTDEQKEVVTNFFDYVKECDITKLKR